MPPVYAIISFFSYRFFHEYTYYSFIEIGAYNTQPDLHYTYVCTAYEVCELRDFLNIASHATGRYSELISVSSHS